MTKEAINFKNQNNNLDFKKMSLDELDELPKHLGVVNIKISQTSFKMLNILNDDSTVMEYFWKDIHSDLLSLDLWFDISKEEGIYLDIGAHTGTYVLTALKSNPNNFIIAIEPFYLNLARLIANLRINDLNYYKNVQGISIAVSDITGVKNFNVNFRGTYLYKSGKIDSSGETIKTIKIDDMNFDKINKKIKGLKIDTEGEDLKVLIGSQKTIQKFKPKIIIEVRNENKANIQEFLDKQNYAMFSVNNLSTTVDLKYLDIDKMINIFAKPL